MYDSKNAELENLDHLFQLFSEGLIPNVIELMAAISDVSTIYPEPEQCSDPTLCLTCG